MKPEKPMHGKKAVVIGASVGGLLAARTLADFYTEVVILERDRFPLKSEPRKGVPQGRHLHTLLPAGQQVMESLFPGLTGQLVSQGAQVIKSWEVGWFFNGAYHHPFERDRKGIGVSRPALEGAIRERVLALPNVQAIENCDVLGLEANRVRSAITGLRLIKRQNGSAEEIMAADLVVDATGRGSRTPAWLEGLGYSRPPEEQVRINMGYTTRYYRRTPHQLPGKKVVIITANPTTPRLGVAMAEEAEKWIVSLGGYFNNHAPTDEAGYLAFARSLASPDLYEFMQQAEPLSAPVQYKYPFSQRYHYEKLAQFPAGLLVFGDALCSFNPIYGQGMIVAAQQAVALQECLSRGTSAGLAQSFFKKAARIIDNPWKLAGGGDLRFPAAEGKRTRLGKFLSWYIAHLHKAAHKSPVVARAFADVTGLLATPPTLLKPSIAFRVMWYSMNVSNPKYQKLNKELESI